MHTTVRWMRTKDRNPGACFILTVAKAGGRYLLNNSKIRAHWFYFLFYGLEVFLFLICYVKFTKIIHGHKVNLSFPQHKKIRSKFILIKSRGWGIALQWFGNSEWFKPNALSNELPKSFKKKMSKCGLWVWSLIKISSVFHTDTTRQST